MAISVQTLKDGAYFEKIILYLNDKICYICCDIHW